jgi:hypothetical protein
MRLIAMSTILLSFSAATALAQLRCFDTGHSIRCPAGCELLKAPNFPGDSFSWRCRRPAPPPPQYSYEPPENSCPPNMYPVTETWCCPFETVYHDGRCVYPRQQRRYANSGSEDPTPLLIILAVIGLAVLGWYDHHSRQLAFAREAADGPVSDDDIATAAANMQEAADRAEDILRQFRERSGGDA